MVSGDAIVAQWGAPARRVTVVGADRDRSCAGETSTHAQKLLEKSQSVTKDKPLVARGGVFLQVRWLDLRRLSGQGFPIIEVLQAAAMTDAVN